MAAAITQGWRQLVVAEAAILLFLYQAGFLQESEMTRHAGLRQPEDARELGDIEPLGCQYPQQTQARLVAEQAIEGRGGFHIYKSTCID